jgi:DNA repair protein RadC
MARPEQWQRYQLAFGFMEQSPIPQAQLYTGEYGRFIRTLREQVVVRSPAQAAQYLMEHIFTPFDAFDQEELWTLLVNSQNRITHEALIYRGNLNQIHTRMAEIFKPAIRCNAAGFILAHNHPSGSVEPSLEDLQMSEETQTLATRLGIDFLDHLIIGHQVWTSLRERGIGTKSE